MRIKRILASGIAVLALAGSLAACGDDSDDDNKSDENSSQTSEGTTDEGDDTTDEGADGTDEGDDTTDEGTDEGADGADGGDGPALSDGETSVKVDGEEVPVGDIQCAKQGGTISIGSGDPEAGFGLILTDEATPQVTSLGLIVDGTSLAVTGDETGSMGSATVAVDGDTYTVTGTAMAVDTDNPGEVGEKSFEIVVTC